MKKPELYTLDRYERRPVRHGRSAIWNNLYYRRKGVRVPYKLDSSTRWQLEFDMLHPWVAYCVHPPHKGEDSRTISIAHQKEFYSFGEAIKWLDQYHMHDYEMERVVYGG